MALAALFLAVIDSCLRTFVTALFSFGLRQLSHYLNAFNILYEVVADVNNEEFYVSTSI
jgi:hypothetical protein